MTVDSIHGEHARLVGAISGALIGIVPLAIGVIEPEMDILVPAGILGGITGGLLGAGYGARVRSRTRPGAVLLAVKMALLAVLLGDVLLCAFLALTAIGESGADVVLFALVILPLMGLAVLGLPAFALALAAGFAWIVVMRGMPARWVGERSAGAA